MLSVLVYGCRAQSAQKIVDATPTFGHVSTLVTYVRMYIRTRICNSTVQFYSIVYIILICGYGQTQPRSNYIERRLCLETKLPAVQC